MGELFDVVSQRLRKQLYHIDAPKMRGAPCFALVVIDGVVVEAPPIARWATGQRIGKVVRWYEKKGATVEVTECRGNHDTT